MPEGGSGKKAGGRGKRGRRKAGRGNRSIEASSRRNFGRSVNDEVHARAQKRANRTGKTVTVDGTRHRPQRRT